ncbi:unnamed protein product [Danaus chrysippus]|uniref:(African queen) hypothetical protein n=1 Tax=Danaus chrysippus TaxID=151541 RepID=A0A8J2R2I1_9NEOP|nr:unnamed protein product [Danaus chrysippus]
MHVYSVRVYFDNLLNVGREVADVEQEINPPTVTDLEKCIKYLKNYKASGLDTIAAEMVKTAGPELIERLHHLITQIWLEETLPQDWCLGIVIPTHKKGDKTVCSNYRGISVLSAAYKMFLG